MGTEVESKMYPSEYNSLRDVYDCTGGGGWDLNYENRNLKSDQYCSTFSFRPLTEEYLGYYKEQLRQTILKHESIFRHQICELHRLYNVQRDMMNEVIRKEQEKYMLPVGSSQKSCLMPSASSGNGMKPCFDSLKEAAVQSCGPDGLTLGNRESLQPKYSKLQKSLFDLELPVNDFINNEEVGERISSASGTKNYLLNHNFHITPEKEGNLLICCGLLPGSDADGFGSNVHLRSTHGLTDLNESFQLEEASGSTSINILGTSTSPEENIQRQHRSVTSYFQHLCNEFPQDRGQGKDKISSHGNLHSEAEFKHKGQSRSSRSLCLGNSSTLSQDEQRNAWEHREFPFSEQNRMESHRKRKLFGVDISDRNDDGSVVASQAFGPSPVDQFEVTNSESFQVSSWKNLPAAYNQNLITEQGNPYSNVFAQLSTSLKTLMPSPIALGEKIAVGSDFRSAFSYQNDQCIVSHRDSKKAHTCHPLVGFNNACVISDSNSASECCGKNNSEVSGSIVDAMSTKALSTGAALPNFYQMNSDFLQGYSQQPINRTEMRKDPSQSLVQDAVSVTHTHQAEFMRYEVDSSRKILGLSHNSHSKSSFVDSAMDGYNSIKDGLLDTDLNRDPVSSKSEGRPKVEGLIVEKELVNHVAGQKHRIDLNLCASEDEDQLIPSCFGADARIVGEREMVPPIMTENKTCVDHELKSIENRLKETSNSSGKESKAPLEGLVEIAADALVAISSSQNTYQGNPICDQLKQLEALQSDSLHWFAEIITSYRSDIEDEVPMSLFKDIACDEDSVPKGPDHFEFMTLNLIETKIEECSYKPQVLENSEHEEKPLPTRPRRGQARRGRQQKDFQQDVLCSLSILSRNEMNEDLQIIEGMVRVDGGTWHSSLSQKNTARSTLRRHRSCGGGAVRSQTASAGAWPSDNQQRKCGEGGTVEVSLVGWGKRTRRLPRQRCSVSNNPSDK